MNVLPRFVMSIKLEQLLLLFIILTTSYNIMAEGVSSTTVRLPAIYHLWGQSAEDKPSITIEEIGKCMGKDNSIRQEDERFKIEAKLVNDEIAISESLVKDNQAARLLLDEEAAAIQAAELETQSRFEAIEKKKAEFAVLTAKKVDSATAKKINTQIDQLNKDIKQENAKALVLNERVRQFQLKQKMFNDNLDELKIKLEKVNDNTHQFNERQKVFNDSLLAFQSQCKGERILEK